MIHQSLLLIKYPELKGKKAYSLYFLTLNTHHELD